MEKDLRSVVIPGGKEEVDMVQENGHLVDAVEFLRAEIWPFTADATPISKREREDILGYNEQGFCV